MQWTIVVLWLLGEGVLPTRGGQLLEARERFTSLAECVRAIPTYEQLVVRDFGERGVVVCAAASESGRLAIAR